MIVHLYSHQNDFDFYVRWGCLCASSLTDMIFFEPASFLWPKFIFVPLSTLVIAQDLPMFHLAFGLCWFQYFPQSRMNKFCNWQGRNSFHLIWTWVRPGRRVMLVTWSSQEGCGVKVDPWTQQWKTWPCNRDFNSKGSWIEYTYLPSNFFFRVWCGHHGIQLPM